MSVEAMKAAWEWIATHKAATKDELAEAVALMVRLESAIKAAQQTKWCSHCKVDTHQADDDVMHIQSHQSVARITGDPGARFRAHIAKHVMQLQTKRQMQMQQSGQQPGVPGAPGPSVGGPAAPGMAGTPRPGAQPAPVRGGQNPPGAVSADHMVDAQAGSRG